MQPCFKHYEKTDAFAASAEQFFWGAFYAFEVKQPGCELQQKYRDAATYHVKGQALPHFWKAQVIAHCQRQSPDWGLTDHELEAQGNVTTTRVICDGMRQVLGCACESQAEITYI
eukprot:1153644-Pelagomonas_calceolata.AAC.4